MNTSQKKRLPRWLTAVFMFVVSTVLVALTYVIDIVGALYYYVIILIALLLWMFVDNQPIEDLGFTWGAWWWLQLILGALIAGVVIGLVIWMEALLEWIVLIPIFITSPVGVVVELVASYALWQGVVATVEEFVFRGYIQQNLDSSLSGLLALVIAAIMFAVTHIPSMVWINVPILSAGIWFFNLTLGGIFLGLAFLRTRRLWLPIGIHFGWNFVQYHIAGFRGEGIFSVTNLGSDILTGGVAGPEAGLMGTLAFVILIVVTWVFTQEYDDKLVVEHRGKLLIMFLAGVLMVAIPAFLGLYFAGFGVFLIIWLVFMVLFLQVWENRILCSHCPHYGKEGRTLRCHANYGLFKLWKYNPAPMSLSEKVQFIIGVSIFIGYPFPFLVWGQQWFFLVFTSLGAVGLATILFGWLCLRCVNFSCPFNRVPKTAVDEFVKQHPEMKKAWKAKGYRIGPDRKSD